MSYQMFLVESVGAPRNHQAIFVETDPIAGVGDIFHVHGNIQDGMAYEHECGRKPEESATFIGKSPLGWVDAAHFGRIGEICGSIPPPKKQFNGPKRLYPTEPLRRCQEWTQEAVQVLRDAGVLQPAPAQPAQSPA